jgi:hypothetical protein
MVACEDIPDGIDTIRVSLFSLTPGLQVVMAQFCLTGSGQRALGEVLAEPRSTEALEQANGRVAFLEPIHQKRDGFRLARQTMHLEAGLWLGRHIPGVFAAKAEDQGAMPSCDFIVTRNRTPFPRRYDRRLHACRGA